MVDGHSQFDLSDELVAFTAMVGVHSQFDLSDDAPRLDDKFILLSSLSKCFACPWNHQTCSVKQGKFNFK